MLESREVKKYERKRKRCGHVGYHDKGGFKYRPNCDAFWEYSETGVILMDYDYVNGANWDPTRIRTIKFKSLKL